MSGSSALATATKIVLIVGSVLILTALISIAVVAVMRKKKTHKNAE